MEATDYRPDALVEIQAVEARRRPDVIAFRDCHLASGLMRLSDVEAWITGDGNEPCDHVSGQSEATITFPTPEDPWAHAAPYRGGTVLQHLQAVAASLVSFYRWGETSAVAFVLTDTTPPPFIARGGYGVGNTPGAGVIRLVVPPGTSEKELVSIYREIRREYLNAIGKTRTVKSVTEQYIADLAIHAVRQNTPGMTWQMLMDSWNDSHPEHYFDDLVRFQRDARRAYTRVTGAQFDWWKTNL
jgi:hypothetical protein